MTTLRAQVDHSADADPAEIVRLLSEAATAAGAEPTTGRLIGMAVNFDPARLTYCTEAEFDAVAAV